MHLFFTLVVKVFYPKYKLSTIFLGNSIHAYYLKGALISFINFWPQNDTIFISS